MHGKTAHMDTFVIDNLPLEKDQPDFIFDSTRLRFPEHFE